MAHEFVIKNGYITSGQSYVYNNLSVTGLTLSSVPTNDDTLTQILARDSSGNVKYRNASSLGGGSSTFTGGTVSGATIFTGGLSANTISATTYYNLPVDIRVTGGTYTNGTATFTNNTGGTFSVTGFSTTIQGLTGLTANNGLSASTSNNVTTIGFSGGTINRSVNFTNGLSANTISATTYYNLPAAPSQVAGSIYQIQYNNGSTFAADSYLTWDFSGYNFIAGLHSITSASYNAIVGGASSNITNAGVVAPNYSAILGGGSNGIVSYGNASVFGFNSVVGGQYNNIYNQSNIPTMHVNDNTIVGGYGNIIQDNKDSTIIGGNTNQIRNVTGQDNFYNNAIINSYNGIIQNTNSISSFFTNAIVSANISDIQEIMNPASVNYNGIFGGTDNHIKDSNVSFIFGGETNNIIPIQGIVSYGNTIIGGDSHQIYNTNPSVNLLVNTIVGGESNMIYEVNNKPDTNYNFIGGGVSNTISESRHSSVIGGSSNNINSTNTSLFDSNHIFGSFVSSIFDSGGGVNVSYNTIVGGTDHNINESSAANTFYNGIFGGYKNTITNGAYNATLGGGNNIINQSSGSTILGGSSNNITSFSNVVILGGTAINATQSNTTYVQNFNINTPPSNDDTLTQVLVRDGVTGNVNYRNASTFGGGSVVQGITAITASNGISASTTSYGTVLGFSGGAISSATRFTNGLTANTISATTYSNLPVTGLTQGSNITITSNGVGGFTIASTASGGSFTGGTVSGGTNFISGLTANTLIYSVVTLSSGATISVNATLGNEFKVTLGGNSVLGNPTGAVDGQYLRFAIRQDGTGARNLTFDTKYRFGNEIGTPSVDLTANKTSYLGVRYNAADDKFDVVSFVSGY